MEPSEDIVNRIVNETEDAKCGVRLLLNCQFDEAAELFADCRSERPCCAIGYCLTKVLRYATSFEQEHKRYAVEAIAEAERDCRGEHGTFRKALRTVADKNDILYQLAVHQLDAASADCYLYQAVVIMTNMDVSSYVKGGWCVRKAWKLYDRLHKECRRLTKWYGVSLNPNDKRSNEGRLIYELYCTVSFGYGLFNLFMSILSPQILKFVSFLGFSSCRRTGLDSLAVVGASPVMRAPLAALTVLWFHTVARSFLALDGAAVDAGVTEAERLLSGLGPELTETMLFVFFKGRIQRLRSNLGRAIEFYTEALTVAGRQAELRQMCQYELGWCKLHLLQWSEACEYFKILKESSKWLPSYYCYVASLCYGASECFDECRSFAGRVSELTKRKNNPVEAFVVFRAKKLYKNEYEINKNNCILFLVELMYFWRVLQNVPTKELKTLLSSVNETRDKKLTCLKCLIEGAIHSVLGDSETATSCLEECVARSEHLKDEKHWSAFAYYELAYLLMKNAKTRERSKALLIHVRDKMHGYFFENRLNLRLHAALKLADKLEHSENN